MGITTIQYQNGAPFIQGYNPNVSYSINETPTLVNSYIYTGNYLDANIQTNNVQGTNNAFQVIVNSGGLLYSIINNNTLNTYVDGNQNIVYKTPPIITANDTASITIAFQGGSISYSRNINYGANYSSGVINYWLPGSFCNHVKQAIDSFIANKTPNGFNSNSTCPYTMMFTTVGGDTFVPNPTCITTGKLDLSAFAITGQDMILITPYHVYGSHTSSTGSITFRHPSGTYETRNITAIASGSYGWVGILDSPVLDIPPIKMLPANFVNYLGVFSKNKILQSLQIPVLRRKQYNYTGMEILVTTFTTPTTTTLNVPDPSLQNNYYSWSSYVQGGDSNGAVIVPVDPIGGTNYQPVLVGALHTGLYAYWDTIQNSDGLHYTAVGIDDNYSKTSYRTTMQSDLDRLSFNSGFFASPSLYPKISEIDLSKFNTYI